MAGPLSYEPSIQSVVQDVLPPGSVVLSGAGGIRRRAVWPVLARATGLGEIAGGEIVIVPRMRAAEVLPYLGEIELGGVCAVIFESWDGIALPSDVPKALPIVIVPPGTDVRRLQTDVERYIARRRRELFALEHELYRGVVEPAIAGAGLSEITTASEGLLQRTAAVDRDGEVIGALGREEGVPRNVLVQARIAVRGPSTGPVLVAGPPKTLALPIMTGKERRGIALLLEAGARLDEEEAGVTALASAAAIVLSRDPEGQLPSMTTVLGGEGSPDRSPLAESRLWLATAFSDPASTDRQLTRALALEMEVRQVERYLAVERGSVLGFVDAEREPEWDSVLKSVSTRLGSETIRVGVGRRYLGRRGARRSAEEALEALMTSTERLVPFQSIELRSLLRGHQGWSEYARVRLEPLLDSSADSGELLATLSAYLAAGRNAKAAARMLNVHRNTLLYRLRRIDARLGTHLGEPDVAFELELAIRVLRAAEP